MGSTCRITNFYLKKNYYFGRQFRFQTMTRTFRTKGMAINENKNTVERIFPQRDLIYVSSSMQGYREEMEDVHTEKINIPGFSNYSFFGVYDGHNGKEVADYIGSNLPTNIFNKIREFGEEEAIKKAFMETDSGCAGKYSTGSTAVISVITPSKVVYVGNVGDSRAVMSVAGLATPLSEDHKPNNENENKRIIQAGGYVAYNRVSGSLAMSRAFGDFRYKENSSKKSEEQAVIAYPDVKSYKIEAETDYLVLACDGIWVCMSSQEVIDFINEQVLVKKDLSKACENLMNECSVKSYDNISIIIIGFLHGLEKEQWLERIGNRYKRLDKESAFLK